MTNEQPLFSIKYCMNAKLICEYNLMSPKYTKTIRLYTVLGVVLTFFFILDAKNLFENKLYFFLYALLCLYLCCFTFIFKRRVKRSFEKDPDNTKEHQMLIYQDHIEIIAPSERNIYKFNYISRFSVKKIGAYLYLTGFRAICIPKEALSEEAINWLKERTGSTEEEEI